MERGDRPQAYVTGLVTGLLSLPLRLRTIVFIAAPIAYKARHHGTEGDSAEHLRSQLILAWLRFSSELCFG